MDKIYIAGTTKEIILNENKEYIDIGLIEKDGSSNPPVDPDNPPVDPDIPGIKKYSISGFAWIDKNQNGQRDILEPRKPGLQVYLLNSVTNEYLKDENENVLTKTTDNNGKYLFENIPNGKYKVIFVYDNEKYDITEYHKEGIIEAENSDVTKHQTTLNGKKIYVGTTEEITINENKQYIDIGLVEKDDLDNPPVDPDDPNKPPVDPDDPDNPPVDPDIPEVKKYSISGIVWNDENENGQRDEGEAGIGGVRVYLLNITQNTYFKDEEGNDLFEVTDASGNYKFEDVEKDKYYVVFRYNSEDYEITTYQKAGVSEDLNSDAIKKETNIDGNETFVGMTDIIDLTQNKNSIDLGLIKNKIFDLKIEKYIQKITVQNKKGTKEYTYNNEKIAKLEIPAKYMVGTNVVIEYKIVVTNVGELAGTVNEIIDEMPETLQFNSELNNNWYKTVNNSASNTSLSNKIINPGESIEETIVLTKTLNEDIKTYTNTAKIGISNNAKHIEDLNIENNSDKVEVIISVQTGTTLKYITTVIGAILVIAIMVLAILLMIKKNSKGLKILFFIAIMLVVIPASSSVEVEAEERLATADEIKEIKSKYGTVSIHYSLVNGMKNFSGSDSRSYSCIDSGNPQCGKEHQYELITDGSDEKVLPKIIAENYTSGGYNETFRKWGSMPEFGMAEGYTENRIHKKSGDTDIYGPFVIDNSNQGWAEEMRNIVGKLDRVIAEVTFDNGGIGIFGIRNNWIGDQYKWGDWADYVWQYNNKQIDYYQYQQLTELKEKLAGFSCRLSTDTLAIRGGGATNPMPEFYLNVTGLPSNVKIVGFRIHFESEEFSSNYNVTRRVKINI